MKSQGIQMLSVYTTEIMIKQITPVFLGRDGGRVFRLQREREVPIALRGRE